MVAIFSGRFRLSLYSRVRVQDNTKCEWKKGHSTTGVPCTQESMYVERTGTENLQPACSVTIFSVLMVA